MNVVKGNTVSFFSSRFDAILVGTVVRVKKNGIVTVDVPESGNMISMWHDVHPDALRSADLFPVETIRGSAWDEEQKNLDE